eukprot:TRINITY_DN12265_c0_g3_i9.p1 TRINITY_DN12265_c0_g3~~TRINITY_DN12265_c0_g3_i9.p1  ORF type:complete len:147 (-),score=10.30 TRINITY_DN12265_c0_g3_i9:274-714(-)
MRSPAQDVLHSRLSNEDSYRMMQCSSKEACRAFLLHERLPCAPYLDVLHCVGSALRIRRRVLDGISNLKDSAARWSVLKGVRYLLVGHQVGGVVEQMNIDAAELEQTDMCQHQSQAAWIIPKHGVLCQPLASPSSVAVDCTIPPAR